MLKFNLPIGRDICLTVSASLNARFGELEKNKFCALSTFLDPRFKDSVFEHSSTRQHVTLWLQTEPVNIVEDILYEPPKKIVHVDSDLWSNFDEHLRSNSQGSGDQPQTTPVITEICSYRSEPLVQRTESLLLWWIQNGERFPTLKLIARKYFSVPQTSVPSERVFSIAGEIYSKKRSCIKPKHASQLLFIHHNTFLV